MHLNAFLKFAALVPLASALAHGQTIPNPSFDAATTPNPPGSVHAPPPGLKHPNVKVQGPFEN